jgi:hypothetical protein
LLGECCGKTRFEILAAVTRKFALIEDMAPQTWYITDVLHDPAVFILCGSFPNLFFMNKPLELFFRPLRTPTAERFAGWKKLVARFLYCETITGRTKNVTLNSN